MDTGSKTHRKPMIKELIIHGVFCTLLMTQMFAVTNTEWVRTRAPALGARPSSRTA